MNIQNGIISGFRLSPQQRRLWSLHQTGDVGAYRVLCTLLIEGKLDQRVLESVLEDIVSRHEILRTTFDRLPGLEAPVQVVNESGIDWQPERDLSSLSAEERLSTLDGWFEKARRKPLNFAGGRLLQASFIALAPLKKALMLLLPAVCSDGTGLKNLVREIAFSYQAVVENCSVEAEPMQYADTAEYLTQLLEAEDTEPGREYWRKYGLLNLAEMKLPGQGCVVSEAAFEPAVFTLQVDLDRLARIKDAARRQGVTLEVFLLTCWQSLLWRLTGQQEFLIGAHFDGRKLESLESLPGAFSRYLPFHAQCPPRSKFSDLLNQVDQLAKQFGEWQDYFSADRFFGAARGPSYFPICFEFENCAGHYGANGATFSILKHYACVDRFNFKLACVSRADHLSLEFRYQEGMFTPAYAECVASEFSTLLDNAAAEPSTEIDELALLSEEARRRVMIQFNATNVQYVRDRLVHERVAEHAAKRPDNIAVVDGDQMLTYRELDARANQLAHYLRSLGVGLDAPVGFCLEPSLEMVVTILGILKAGGAYVPIDHSYPEERLAFIIKDLKSQVLITRRQFAEWIADRPKHLLILEEHRSRIEQYSDLNPASKVAPENLAYLIYTSGSTGRPKGVMISHRGLMNYLNWCSETYAAAEGQGSALHSSIAFDLTVTSLFPPLLAGKPVVLVNNDRSWEGLSELFRTQKDFGLIKITPSHLRMLNLLMKPEEVRGVTRLLVIGGEALYAEDLTVWQEQSPQTRLINEYGPTETVVGCCVYEITAGAAISGAAPIGRPVANTQIYILDERMEPVPPMIVGEIYIGGEGVARGYWNRSDLTAERFVPNRFGAAGTRLYKTGDLGRYRADDEIEFLGRSDQQVKFKGYRIELGEIEAVICEHEAVREAAVEIEGHAAEKRMVAYIAGGAGAQLTGQELQSYLRKKLPDYMVPQIFKVIQQLPLTSNGKIDRRALREIDTESQTIRKIYVAPRTPTEALLAGLWAKALNVERVSIYDNFFELGGDSILGIQIASRANKEGLKFAPRQLFRYSTIAKLAAVIEIAAPAEAERGENTGLAPLTPIQRWFFEKDFADRHHWNQALTFEPTQPLETAILDRAIHHLVARHDALRLSFIEGPEGWRQLVTEPRELRRVVEVDFSKVPDEVLEPAVEKFASDLQASMVLAEGSLIRAGVIRLGERKPARLLLILHHLVVDIVSWGILIEDLQSAYQQLSRGESAQLPAQSTSYKIWAEHLKEHANSLPLRQELSYWLTESRRSARRLPADFPDGLNIEASTRTIWSTLTVEETTALLQQIPKAYRTMINDVLLAALVQALSGWTKSRSLLVDLENHGREEVFDNVHLSRTVGWFTSIFPLLLEIGGAMTPPEALKAVKEQIRGVPNGGIGYGLLRYLSDDNEIVEQLKRLPQAEVCFNYVGRVENSMSESQLLGRVYGAIGPTKNPKARRPYLIEINGDIRQGQLRMAWSYSENVHHAATVTSLAESFNQALRDIINHPLPGDGGRRASSDFLLSGLNQRQLDDLIGELSKIED